mmetsp:Transcript_56501/g.156230  ORF Transcript_56501/g.156230 Transcript_56501/m.156230 type:complete len:202 (+) Transcript_56501:935-1540(+)
MDGRVPNHTGRTLPFSVFMLVTITFMIINQGGLLGFTSAANPVFVMEPSPFKTAFMTAEQYASTIVTALSNTVASASNMTNMTDSNGTIAASAIVSTSSGANSWDGSQLYVLRNVGDTRLVYVLVFAIACIIRSVLNPDLCTTIKFPAVKQMLTLQDHAPIIDAWPALDEKSRDEINGLDDNDMCIAYAPSLAFEVADGPR